MSVSRVVFCQKYQQELPGLEKAPLVGPVGENIFQHTSQKAWQEWVELEIKIINEERLDLSEINAQERLYKQMLEFLNLNS